MKAILSWSWLVFLLIGCGGKYAMEEGSESVQSSVENAVDGEGGGEQAGAEQAVDENAVQNAERKIIYEGRISLVVEEFEKIETAIPQLVEQFEGYLKSVDVNRREGRRRSGRWIARIPADRFGEFLAEVSELGIAEEQKQTTEDVTMEYLDLEARIAGKKKLEERIEKVLQQEGEKLSDQLEGERELMRVRSEIDSMQGRLKYLKNRVAFSTVTIDAREEKDYVPQKAPDFTGRIGIAWKNSIRELKETGQDFVVAAVYFAPWFIPLSVLVVGLTFGWKRARRSKTTDKNKSP